MSTVTSAPVHARFAAFWGEMQGVPARDLRPLLKKHDLDNVPLKTLSRLAKAVGMPRDARVALLRHHELNLRSLVQSTKAISVHGLSTGKAWENRQLGRVGGFFAERFPKVSAHATSAVERLGSFTGKVGAAAGEVVKKGGFFGNLLGKIGGALSTVGKLARMVPLVNIAFIGVDAFKFLRDPSMANLAKLGLSVGAALPIPGASLLGGVRTAVEVAPMAARFGSRLLGGGEPQPA